MTSKKLFQQSISLSLLLFAVGSGHVQAATPLLLVADQIGAQDITDRSVEQPSADDGLKSDESRNDKTVVVRGKRPTNKIDRQVYEVDKKAADRGESAAGALSKVPGVTVTPTGNVSLRGNAVEIYINNKPSPIMSGDNRSAALRAMPSSAISSIEVISNPGAQFESGSAGSIINIVTRKAIVPGMLGNITGQLNSNKGYSASTFIQNSKKNVSTTFFGNLASTPGQSRSGFTTSPGQLQPGTSTNSEGLSETRGLIASMNLTVDVNLGERDALAVQASAMHALTKTRSEGVSGIYDADTMLSKNYARFDEGRYIIENNSFGLTWTRFGSNIGDNLKADAKITRKVSVISTDSDLIFDPSLISVADVPSQLSNWSRSRQTSGILSVDYTTTVGNDQVTTGLQVTADTSKEPNLALAPSTNGGIPVVNARLSNSFEYTQMLLGSYVTYQKAVGEHWVVLAGVRAETFNFNGRNGDNKPGVKSNYTNVSPSIFATYVISDATKVRLNYVRRFVRPTPRDFNPSVVYIDSQSVRAGNSSLKPQETDSFEASFEHSRIGKSYAMRAYHLDNRNLITPITRVVPDLQGTGGNILQVSRENSGGSRQTGLQLTYSGQFANKWYLNLNTNIYSMGIDVPSRSVKQALITNSSQIGVSYIAQNQDSLSLNFSIQGRQITGDGYIEGYATNSMSYTHNISKTLNLNITVENAFKTAKLRIVRDSPDVKAQSWSTLQRPTLYVSLSRRFGTGIFKP